MELEIINQLVKCRRLKPQALISLDKCKECEHHKGLELTMKGINNLPDVYDILCGLPSRVRVEYQVEEVENGSSNI